MPNEISARHVDGVPDGTQIPTAFERVAYRARLTELADSCEESAAAFRAIADPPDDEPPEGDDPEYDAAMALADTTALLVATVRELLADTEIGEGAL